MNWPALVVFIAIPTVLIVAAVLSPWGRDDDTRNNRPRWHARRPR